jgi:hypothetical protein
MSGVTLPMLLIQSSCMGYSKSPTWVVQLISPDFFLFWYVYSSNGLGYVPQACRIHDTYYAIFHHGRRIMDVCFNLCGYFQDFRLTTDIIYFNIPSASVLVGGA